jgi:hypothetical protein
LQCNDYYGIIDILEEKINMKKCKDCIYYKNGCAFDKFGEFVACAQFKAKSNDKKDNREN